MASGDTIEQLNYEVILKDSSFKSDLDELLKYAEKFNTNMTSALSLKKMANGSGIDDIRKKLDDATASTDKLGKSHEKYNARVKEGNTALTGTADLMRTISRLTGVAFGVEGVRRFFSALVDVTGQFEVQKMALTSMLQSADKADEIFNTLRQNALNSPYTFQDLTKYAKQLTAFNIDTDKLVETENRLADVAAGLGVDMGRIILAYGQVKAAGVLKGTELRQFTEAGVPLLQSLAEQIKETEGNAISLSEVFQRISKKQIPFEMVEEAFRRMTDEGGKFYNMQEVLVNTLQGKIGKLRDVWQQSLYDIGTANDSWLKGGVDIITKLVANLDKLGAVIKPVIVGFGAYAAVLAIVAMRQKLVAAAEFIRALRNIATGATTVTAAMTAMNISMSGVAAAIGIIVAAGFALVSVFKKINGPMEKFRKELDEIHEHASDTSQYNAEIGRLEMLRKTLNDSNNSYEQRKRALNEIKTIVPAYHADLTTEGKLIRDNKTALDDYIASIHRKAKTEAAENELKGLYTKQFEISSKRIALWKEVDELKDIDVTSTAFGYGFVGPNRAQNNSLSERDKRLEQLHLLNEEYAEVGSRIEDINKILSSMDIPIIGGDGPTWGPNGVAGGNSQLEAIQAGISALEGYRDAFQKLEPYFGDETSSVMAKIFGGDASAYEGLDRQIVKLTEHLRELGGGNEADSILKRLGLDKVSQILEGQKAIEAWRKEIERLQENWDSSKGESKGTLQRILDDFKKVEQEIGDDESLLLALGKDPDAFFAALALRDTAAAQKAQAIKDNLTNIANDILSDKTGGGLSNLADKSIEDLEAMKTVLDNLEIPQEIADVIENPDLLKALNDELSKLRDNWVEIINSTESATEDKDNKEKLERLKEIATEAAGLFSSVAELASAYGKDDLSSALSFIGDSLSILESSFDSFSKGKVAEGVLKILGGVIKKVINAQKEVAKLKQSIRAAEEAGRAATLSDLLGLGVSSVFGTNQMKQASNAAKVLTEVQNSMNANRGNLSGKMNLKNSFWSITKWKPESLASLAASVGRELYDVYGNLNADTLQAILNTYTNLGTKEREWIQQAINDSNAYKEAMEQLEGVMESLVGDIVSTAADTIVDQWAKAGDAALDYADILDDVTRSYAKMITQSLLLDSVFDDSMKNGLLKKFQENDMQGVMDLVLGGLQQIQNMAPQIAGILEPLRPYLSTSGTEGGTLKEGINKELVEGNSSLIASYINAMRADLSVIRGFQTSGWQDVSSIRVSIPTLLDHTAKIEANTFDQAQNSSEILRRLSSIITPSTTGGSAVRTTR